MEIIDSKIQGNLLQEFTAKYLEEHKELVEHIRETTKKQLLISGVVSSAEYKHIWQLMDELNTIMWESYMIKDKNFGRQEGYKIMGLLEQWAERH